MSPPQRRWLDRVERREPHGPMLPRCSARRGEGLDDLPRPEMRASGFGEGREPQFDAGDLPKRPLEIARSPCESAFALRHRALHEERKAAETGFPERARQFVGFDGKGTGLIQRSLYDRKLREIPQRKGLLCPRAGATCEVESIERLAARTPPETEVSISRADVEDCRGRAENIASRLVSIERLAEKAQGLRVVDLAQADVVQCTALAKQVAAAPRERQRFGCRFPCRSAPVSRPQCATKRLQGTALQRDIAEAPEH